MSFPELFSIKSRINNQEKDARAMNPKFDQFGNNQAALMLSPVFKTKTLYAMPMPSRLEGFVNTDRKAEQLAAHWMRALGFGDAWATRRGPDGGVDVRGRRVLAGVRRRAERVGRPDLQRLYGARGADSRKELFYFSAAGYSRFALDYAAEHSIYLFTYDLHGRLSCANKMTEEKVAKLVDQRNEQVAKWEVHVPHRLWLTRRGPGSPMRPPLPIRRITLRVDESLH